MIHPISLGGISISTHLHLAELHRYYERSQESGEDPTVDISASGGERDERNGFDVWVDVSLLYTFEISSSRQSRVMLYELSICFEGEGGFDDSIWWLFDFSVFRFSVHTAGRDWILIHFLLVTLTSPFLSVDAFRVCWTRKPSILLYCNV